MKSYFLTIDHFELLLNLRCGAGSPGLLGVRQKGRGKYQVLGLPRDLEAHIAPFQAPLVLSLVERRRDLDWKGNFASPQDALTALEFELRRLGDGQ